MYQLRWGEWQFRGHLEDHHIGIQDVKITNAWPTQTNSSVEGSATTETKRNPIQVSFYLNYVLGHTNQTLESLSVFWQDKLGQKWPMVWGGDRAPILTPNLMQLVKCDISPILHKGGSFAVARIDFTFQEVLADEGNNNGSYGL